MNLVQRITRKYSDDLDSHLEAGCQIARATGEDGRPPLTRAQRWHFTAQSLLRRGLVDGHPALTMFDKHCYHGLGTRNRMEEAVKIFASALPVIHQQGLQFHFGLMRDFLSAAVLASDEMSASTLEGALWSATALLAKVAGLRGPGEYPSQVVLCQRLAASNLIEFDLAGDLPSQDPARVRVAAQLLLNEIM